MQSYILTSKQFHNKPIDCIFWNCMQWMPGYCQLILWIAGGLDYVNKRPNCLLFLLPEAINEVEICVKNMYNIPTWMEYQVSRWTTWLANTSVRIVISVSNSWYNAECFACVYHVNIYCISFAHSICTANITGQCSWKAAWCATIEGR